MQHRHCQERQLLVKSGDSTFDPQPSPRFSRTPAGFDSKSRQPFVGEHSREILNGLCGFSQNEIESLSKSGAVQISRQQSKL